MGIMIKALGIKMGLIINGKKPKRNPEKICNCCGIKIYNKYRSSLYCKECSEVISYIHQRIGSVKSILKERFKEFDFNIKVDKIKKR